MHAYALSARMSKAVLSASSASYSAALASRCLQLVQHYFPAVRDHFLSVLPAKHHHGLKKHFDKVAEVSLDVASGVC